MTKENIQKQIWQKPEIQDLDVKNTASGPIDWHIESTSSNDNLAPS